MKPILFTNSPVFKNFVLRTYHKVLWVDTPMSRCSYQGCNVTPVHHLLPMMKEYEIRSFVDPYARLEELVLQRAKDLVAEAEVTGRRLHVKYSGGLDSLLVLLALRSINADFVTYLTPVSLKEAPEVFRKFIAGRDYCYVGDRSLFDGLIVTGDGADALFIDMLAKGPVAKFNNSILDADWKDSFIKGMYGNNEENEFVLDLLAPITEECPWPVRTLRDFFAWTGITLFYQNEVYGWTQTMPNLQTNIAHFRPFFPTKDFVEWSLGQEPVARFPNFNDYKPAFRKLCEKLSGLDFGHIRKVFSHGRTVSSEPMRLIVMEDFSAGTTTDIERIALFGND